jgi:hypothetical protein
MLRRDMEQSTIRVLRRPPRDHAVHDILEAIESVGMITAIVLYDLPPSIGLAECRAHFARIAPDFMRVRGFLRKQFICSSDGRVAGGVYMWENRAAAEHFYDGPWRKGIVERYGNIPRIQYFETVALADTASGYAGPVEPSTEATEELAE